MSRGLFFEELEDDEQDEAPPTRTGPAEVGDTEDSEYCKRRLVKKVQRKKVGLLSGVIVRGLEKKVVLGLVYSLS